MYSLYGIPNCDTVKKVKKVLDKKGLEYIFINFKNSPPKESELNRWGQFLGELPVNRRGTTFRKIKDNYNNASKKEQMSILMANSSAIKRPILEKAGQVLSIGFEEQVLQEL